ncbi:SigB/SigF/SigG family RNA polymerase sigma factor [Alkalibacter saccharofermentans]|uniref:RNA polymerase, sigma 37 subunit, RpsB/SigB n=1 Tax=Alkalibacter saccharofermentans DSM 14828 TaxID=1120975 RepID=A0A1M5A1G8_9FIRM|nr:SigB/SigF/SigG family RNA polymerase sigma factor [Alkalibacter saccharofermentans]SHF23766.1 RNA polymerase, sigma 37 subunit, RpsB/SigB [Alkalibacter saccharofermentans DSM 14828]
MVKEASGKVNVKNQDRKKYIEELFQQYIATKDIEIRNRIFKEFMYIPEILSKKYINKGVDFEDIYQVASLGLIYAIERYDPSKGYEFSSFATPTILGEIKKYFRDKEWIIKVPRRIQELSRKINMSKDHLQHKLMRMPTIKDIASYLDIPEEDVIEAMEGSYAYSPTSLDVRISNSKDENDLSLFEVLGIEDQHMTEIEDKDLIKNIFEEMDDYDKKIIVDRYYNNKSQSEIAHDLGVSQMTISRLEKKIIKKLREKITT